MNRLIEKYHQEIQTILRFVDLDGGTRPPHHVILRYALKKKLRDYLGIFPKWRTPPIPPFGNPLFEEKKIIVYFAF